MTIRGINLPEDWSKLKCKRKLVDMGHIQNGEFVGKLWHIARTEFGDYELYIDGKPYAIASSLHFLLDELWAMDGVDRSEKPIPECCPVCHNEEHLPGARLCMICGAPLGDGSSAHDQAENVPIKRKFWGVSNRYFDNGRVEVDIFPVEAAAKPENRSNEGRICDEYTDYFDTYEEASAWAEESKNA